MDTPLRLSVAGEVRAELARQRRSAREMAEGVGIPATTLQRRLTGASALNLDEIEAIGRWLGIPISRLLVETDRAAAS